MGVHLCNLYEFMPAMVGNKCIKLSLNFIWIKIHQYRTYTCISWVIVQNISLTGPGYTVMMLRITGQSCIIQTTLLVNCVITTTGLSNIMSILSDGSSIVSRIPALSSIMSRTPDQSIFVLKTLLIQCNVQNTQLVQYNIQNTSMLQYNVQNTVTWSPIKEYLSSP